ncbi:MAG: hypothetical protein H8D49_01920 [Dehalococcoidia bacterium]|nr:hypothetical protein [Dehalococcoidia bacterium]
MNQWLLASLQRGPAHTFSEWELKMHCGELEDLRDGGLMVRDLEAEQSEFYCDRWGRRLELVRMDGGIFGIDTQDPDEPIIELDSRELVRYRFNYDRWQRTIREANGLKGVTSRLERHLFFLGEKVDVGNILGFVLGFFNQRDMALNLLLGLPERLPSRYDAIVVTTPFSTPVPQQDIAHLERLGVYLVPPLNHETLMIECPRLQVKRREMRGVVLSPAQKADYDRYEYKCELPINLTGKVTKSGNNVVLVGDTPVEIGDVPFLLFMRLAVELRRSKSGIVPKVDLRSEGYFGEGTDDHAINRLRNCFIRALGDLDRRDFIETCQPKRLRLSAHPDLVTWNADKLSDHDDERVKALVRQLS